MHQRPICTVGLLGGAASAVIIASLASPAFAQGSAERGAETVDEVVVTGTIIRGVAPVGSLTWTPPVFLASAFMGATRSW